MPSDQPITAYLAVGANLGQRLATIRSAIEMLRESENLQVARVSSLLENPAVGGPADSPAFLNGAIEVTTTLDATALLHRLLEIEQALGRQRREKWSPRTIDLDLLLYGDAIIDTPDLIVPHPLLHERRFVLEPLCQIAPDLMHPVLNRSIRELLDRLNAKTQTRNSE